MTVVTWGGALPKTLEAAEALSESGIEAEVIDLRTLRPLDDEAIFESVQTSRRAVVVEDGWRSVGLNAEISARITEECFYELDAPVGRVCGREVPTPYAKHLEDASIPQVDDIIDACKETVEHHV